MINILVSKLSSNYNTADPAAYIIGDWQQLDPIFAGRLAYLAKVKGVKVKLTEGYRSTARQTELYNQYLEFKRTGKGSIKLAAKPGTSWHEFRLAVDTSTQPIRSMGNADLKAYGLCKPIKSEGWHIQPIETSGSSNRVKWAPVYQESEESEEEEMKRYNSVAELPKALQKEAQELVDSGALAGSDGKLDVTEDMIRTMIVGKRLVEKLLKGGK